MLKRAFSIFVLGIFLAHFAGFYIYFFTQLHLVRQEMRAKLKELPAEELDLLILSMEEYQHAKVEEHEVKVDGKMYDIARVEQLGNQVLIYCVHDAAEDNLLAFLDKILSLPLKDKSVPHGVLHFYTLHFLPAQFDFTLPEFTSPSSVTAYSAITSQFISADIFYPPKF
jgi:hypothetical protein